jgi:hypothetical protein
MFAWTVATKGKLFSRVSTSRLSASVVARLLPSGSSICTRNCGMPALGNNDRPITGTRATLPANKAAATAIVAIRCCMHQCSSGR